MTETNVTRSAGGRSPKDRLADLIESFERRNPGLVRLMIGFRWAGLRTVHPDARTWLALGAAGSSAGLVVRAVSERLTGRRPPVAASVPAGLLGTWFALWRWDTARFRRSRLVLALDLPPDARDRLLDDLAERGLAVEPWEGPVGVGGRRRGLVCRARDVRRVNAAIDEISAGRGSDGGTGALVGS